MLTKMTSTSFTEINSKAITYVVPDTRIQSINVAMMSQVMKKHTRTHARTYTHTQRLVT